MQRKDSLLVIVLKLTNFNFANICSKPVFHFIDFMNPNSFIRQGMTTWCELHFVLVVGQSGVGGTHRHHEQQLILLATGVNILPEISKKNRCFIKKIDDNLTSAKN